MRDREFCGANCAEIEGVMRRSPVLYTVLGQARCMFTVRVPMKNLGAGYDYVDCSAAGALAQRIHDEAHDFARVRVCGHLSTYRNKELGTKRTQLTVEGFEVLSIPSAGEA